MPRLSKNASTQACSAIFILHRPFICAAEAARAVGVSCNADDSAAAQDFLAALEKLCGAVEIPTLAEYGIDRGEFFAAMDKMADDALASGSPANTIREVAKQDILAIYASLWN